MYGEKRRTRKNKKEKEKKIINQNYLIYIHE